MDLPSENWFVVQLKPHGLLRAKTNLKRQGFPVFSPLTQLPESKPLFPGYLFVHFDPQIPGWTKINNTFGVSRLITDDRYQPKGLPAAWMAGLRERCSNAGNLLPPDDLRIGEKVRVVSGPFADSVLSIDGFDRDGRIRALFDLMGRMIVVNFPSHKVERAR